MTSDPVKKATELRDMKLAKALGFSEDWSKYEGFDVEELRECFQRHSPTGGKGAFAARVTGERERDMLVAAIRFIFADNPKVKKADPGVWIVVTRGYRADG